MSEKREFIKQYVLNRALAMDVTLDPHAAAKAANEAWKFIESATPETVRPLAPYSAHVDGKFAP